MSNQQRREYQQESFDERHKRITLYLELDLFKELMYRREQAQIGRASCRETVYI